MGGVKGNRLDIIENLQALCRDCHTKYGDVAKQLVYLVAKHAIKLKMNAVKLLEFLEKL